MMWSKAAYPCIALLACFGVSACAYTEPTQDLPPEEKFVELDQPGSFDIYVDTTGPNGFYAQAEHQAFYTSQEEYEAAAPGLYAQAQQAGLPLRFVFGPQMRAQKTAGFEGADLAPQWTQVIERWGYVVTFSTPSYKYVSGCVSQNAYAANLRIHRFARGVDAYGTQLRDFHLAAYRGVRDSRLCIGLVETETKWPNWCDCPGQRMREAYTDLSAGIRQGLQNAGIPYAQAVVLTAALAPMAILSFAAVAL